jgi:hypothetical protein
MKATTHGKASVVILTGYVATLVLYYFMAWRASEGESNPMFISLLPQKF